MERRQFHQTYVLTQAGNQLEEARGRPFARAIVELAFEQVAAAIETAVSNSARRRLRLRLLEC